ncbi:MAG: TonB-dependent receptor [bacterium]
MICNQLKLSKYDLRIPMLILIIISSVKIYPQTDSINIYDLTLAQLSNMKITSAAKVEQNLSEVPSTIHVITANEIQENGFFTIEEALSTLPGFQFRNILGINSYVFQRGITNQNNLILLLIDGVQINELNSGGFYAGAQYNLSNVERIEVIYGPASVAYGTNAVTGIINIISKNATDKKVEAHASIGTFNTSKIDFIYSYINDEKTFGVSAAGMFKKSDKADLKGSEGDNNWTDQMDNYEDDYSLDLKINSGDFVFGTNYVQKQTSTATLNKSVGTIYRDYGTLWNIRFINNYIKYNNSISEKLAFTSMLYNRNATVLDNSIYYVVDTAQVGYYRPNNLTGFEAIMNYETNEVFSITGGFTFEYEQLAKSASISISDSPENKPPAPAKPPMVHNRLASIFLEPRLTLFDNLFLSAGIRYDNSSIYDQVLTPRIGLCYNFQRHIFRVSYASAFRAPKPWDYTDGLGNSSLVPEKMKSFETSITLTLSDNYKVDLIGYRNNLEKAIVKEVTNSGYRWINSGQVKTYGFEMYFRYTSQNIKSSLNYTFTKSTNELDVLIPEISEHCGSASITYSFSKYLKLNLQANYIGKRDNPKLITTTGTKVIDPYLILNAALSLLDYNGFDIQLMVKNLFDTEYYHTSNRESDRYRQPQQTILLSVGYALNY